MNGYPLFLNLKGERCLVFGGGKVATRKVQALLRRGAKVTCISKDFCKPLRKLADAGTSLRDSEIPRSSLRVRQRRTKQSPGSGSIRPNPLLTQRMASLRLLRRPAKILGGTPRPPAGEAGNDELKGARLVIAATSDRDFNAKVARACRKKRIWVNVVDDPELCDFTVPAVVERGPLQIAISTDGTSPLFARKLREALEKVIPPSTGRLLEKLGKMRREFLKKR